MSDNRAVAPVPHRLAIRRLMRASAKAALATALAGDGSVGGWPYASLVTVATDHDGSPILLLSGLSEHTRAIAGDPRVSLLFDGTEGFDNPQQGPRATVLGRASRSVDPAHRARFLARHPAAASYAGFGDFAVWRVEMERAHYIGGFARAVWVEDRLSADAGAARRLAAAESGILAAANRALGAASPGRVVAVDVDGCDLRDGGRIRRLDFDAAAEDAESALAAVIAALARVGARA